MLQREAGRELGQLPDELAVSVVTAAESELGVLCAKDTDPRPPPRDTRTGARTYPLLPVDALREAATPAS